MEESFKLRAWTKADIPALAKYLNNGKSLEYPPNCSRLTQQDLIIRELEEKRRSWADS